MGEYKVYMHINKINGKKYIGITRQRIERRWRSNGEGYKVCDYFYHAIQKYGWENFDHIVIKDNLTQEEAEQEEIRLIKEHDTTSKDKGYNIANGGRVAGKYTKETRMKMSEKAKLREVDYTKLNKMWENNKGRKYNEEHRSKISKALSGRKLSEDHVERIKWSHIGLQLTEEHKQKIRENTKNALNDPIIKEKISKASKEWWGKEENKKRHRQKKMKTNLSVVLTNTGEVFDNHLVAWEKIGVQYSKILSNCLGDSLSAGKDKEGNPFIWVFEKDYNPELDYKKMYNRKKSINMGLSRTKKVVCLNTKEVFDSMLEAGKKYNVKSNGISSVCRGKRKYAGKLPDGTKLQWSYLEDYQASK